MQFRLIVLACLSVVGCSKRVVPTDVSNAQGLEAAVYRAAPVGVPLDSAEHALTRDGFACVHGGFGVPAMRCTRATSIRGGATERRWRIDFLSGEYLVGDMAATVDDVRK